MITIIGSPETPEYDACLHLQQCIIDEWAFIRQSETQHIWLVAGAQCFGQTKRDIDIVLLGEFDPPIRYQQSRPFFYNHQQKTVSNAFVDSLCLAIELKDHPIRRVKFTGSTVEVLYKNHWHNATEQNSKQLYSVRNYIEHHNLVAPQITNLLWLRNVATHELPDPPHNILGARITWSQILNIVGQIEQLRPINANEWILSAQRSHTQIKMNLVANLFTRELTPTALDRQRLERITQYRLALTDIAPPLETMLIMRGRGGTGKTVRLLQLAKRLYDDEGARIIVLTYNKALVADLRRLLTLMGISSDLTSRIIVIRTVHSFFRSLLSYFDLIAQTNSNSEFFVEYENAKIEFMTYLQSGVITNEDIEQRKNDACEDLIWDYVFIDEAQDFPEDERTILKHLYQPQQLVIADGMSQLIRSLNHAEWTKFTTKRTVKTYSNSLRMKSNITRFVNTIAQYFGINDQWLSDDSITGGKIVIIEGEYRHYKHVHQRLLQQNTADGNKQIDMLMCVPPDLAHSNDTQASSLIAELLQTWGYQTWDGTDDEIRSSYPTDVEQFRIVQYDSCRGLEGWISINIALDRFYSYKFNVVSEQLKQQQAEPGVFQHDEDQIRRIVVQWLLIPLTRAIDTLVINVSDHTSPVYKVLHAAYQHHSDTIEWIR